MMEQEPTNYREYENEIVSEEKREELRAAGFSNDLKTVMNSKQGRRFLYHLLHEICNLDGQTFTGNSKTYFNEGAREVARIVNDEMQLVDFENYLQFMREIRYGFTIPEEKEQYGP